jgi:hypothetical protein
MKDILNPGLPNPGLPEPRVKTRESEKKIQLVKLFRKSLEACS